MFTPNNSRPLPFKSRKDSHLSTAHQPRVHYANVTSVAYAVTLMLHRITKQQLHAMTLCEAASLSAMTT